MEQEDHGYGLVQRLRPLNAVDGNAGRVYRLLRGLEEEGLVGSTWGPSEVGPPRRVYHISEAGARSLDTWATALEGNRRILDTYLARHAAVRRRRPAAAARRSPSRTAPATRETSARTSGRAAVASAR